MTLQLRRILGALFLAVAIYGGFVIYTGYHKLESALTHFSWWTFFAALALSCLNYVFRFLKWNFYLKRLGVSSIPLLDNFLIFLSGFVLTVTPGKVGEVFKSAVLQRTHGITMSKTAPIVIAERLTDVVAMVSLILLGSLGFQGGLLWALLGSLAVVSALILIAWRRPMNWIIQALRSKGGRWGTFAPQLESAYESLRIISSPRALIFPTLVSLVGWGGEGLSLWLLLQGLSESTEITLSVFFYATSTLAGALIPVPGGLGVSEALLQSQMVELGGVEAGSATASMLMIRFATLWWAVLVGFVALALLRARFPKLLQEASK